MTWEEQIRKKMQQHGETWEDAVHHTLTDEQLKDRFYGCAFTLWTDKSVYFHVQYDHIDMVGRVPRHPDGTPPESMGL